MIVRRYDESEKQLRKTVELDPNFQVGYFSLANTLQMQGRYAESVEAYARAREIAGNAVEAAAMRASFKKGGWRGFALDFSKYDWMSDNRPKYMDATRFASIGETEKALDALEQAYAEHETFMMLVKVDPRFDPLRKRPALSGFAAESRFSTMSFQGHQSLPKSIIQTPAVKSSSLPYAQ